MLSTSSISTTITTITTITTEIITENQEINNNENNEDILKDIPQLSELISSIDISIIRSINEINELKNTISIIIKRAYLDNINPEEYLKIILLISFKKRNHEKSLASGIGAGEKNILRIIVQEIYRYNQNIIKRILPLIPIYGSWRDLQIIAENSYSDDEIKELSNDITKIFAQQLQKDNENIKLSDENCPSNACKYAPHEFRHHGSRKNRKAEKKSNGRKIQAHLGDSIASRLFPDSKIHIRPLYRKLLSSLNERLTKKGFLIEPLMCKKKKSDIKFTCASKGSLNKYRKSILKDSVAAAKWKKSMSKSSNAVVDIDDLTDISRQIIDDEDLDIISLMISKSITTFRNNRSELAEKASKLLKKLINSQETGSENLDSLINELQIGSGILIYPIIDSNGSNQSKIIAQLISAYLISRAQKLSFFIFDGVKVNTIEEEDKINPSTTTSTTTTETSESGLVKNSKSKWKPEELEEIKYAKSFLNRIKIISNNLFDLRNRSDLERITVSITSLLSSIPYDSTDLNSIRSTDVLFLTTSSLDELREDIEQYKTTLQNLQNRPENQANLRTLCIHKLIQTYNSSDEIVPLIMRSTGIITKKSEVTLDLLLIMDLTASMGSWMQQAKNHLINIVNSLRDETGIGEIRIGFIGYRDYNDEGRTVYHQFLPISASNPVISLLREQSPSGGADAPEDVLSGFNIARNEFNWRSNLRLMLFVADAPAHGYYTTTRGDSYPTGRCPDQLPPHLNLEETTRSLALQHNVDLLFCRLNNTTKKMEEMFSNVYHSGGFGVLPITSGPEAFRSAILSTISSSILKVLTPENVSGLQTFSGSTVSSLISTLNSSLRESFNFISKSFEEIKDTTSMNIVNHEEEKVEEEEDIVGEAGIELTIEGEDDEEEREELDDEKKDEEILPVSKKLKTSARVLPSTIDTKITARTDYERILHELNLEELNPVRLALGMPVEKSLLEKSTEVLLAAGVTVQDLVDQNYPEEIVDVMRTTGMKKLGTI